MRPVMVMRSGLSRSAGMHSSSGRTNVHGTAYPRFYRESVFRASPSTFITPVRFYAPRFTPGDILHGPRRSYYNFWLGRHAHGSGSIRATLPRIPRMPSQLLADGLPAGEFTAGSLPGTAWTPRRQGGYDPSGQAPLNPQVKSLIAGEVQRQLAQESMESQKRRKMRCPRPNMRLPFWRITILTFLWYPAA